MCATAPSGTVAAAVLAIALKVRWPSRAAQSRHSSASRDFPTPAGPQIIQPRQCWSVIRACLKACRYGSRPTNGQRPMTASQPPARRMGGLRSPRGPRCGTPPAYDPVVACSMSSSVLSPEGPLSPPMRLSLTASSATPRATPCADAWSSVLPERAGKRPALHCCGLHAGPGPGLWSGSDEYVRGMHLGRMADLGMRTAPCAGIAGNGIRRVTCRTGRICTTTPGPQNAASPTAVGEARRGRVRRRGEDVHDGAGPLHASAVEGPAQDEPRLLLAG